MKMSTELLLSLQENNLDEKCLYKDKLYMNIHTGVIYCAHCEAIDIKSGNWYPVMWDEETKTWVEWEE